MNIDPFKSQLIIGASVFGITLLSILIIFHSFCFFFSLFVAWFALQTPGLFLGFFPKKSFAAKKVFITGDSAGIGKSFSSILAKNGAQVSGCSRHSEHLIADLSSPEDVAKIVANLNETKPELVILNAGIYGNNLTNTSQIFKMMSVNVDCNVEIVKSLNYYPDIIVISSIMADVTIPYCEVYCATKAFITTFFSSLNVTYPGNILIVSPATVSTEIFSGELFGKKSPKEKHGPLILEPDFVADRALRALGNFSEIHVGLAANLFIVFSKIIPRGIFGFFSGKFFAWNRKIDEFLLKKMSKNHEKAK